MYASRIYEDMGIDEKFSNYLILQMSTRLQFLLTSRCSSCAPHAETDKWLSQHPIYRVKDLSSYWKWE